MPGVDVERYLCQKRDIHHCEKSEFRKNVVYGNGCLHPLDSKRRLYHLRGMYRVGNEQLMGR